MGGKSKSKIHERKSEPSSSVVRVLDLPVQTILVLPDLDMKYNGINGQKWITLVQRLLKVAYMGKHLTEDSPSEDDPKIETWESEETYIMNWMVKNMEEEQRDDYLLINCVCDLWQEINKSCAEMHSDYRVYDLREQERKLKQRSLTIASYTAKLKAIWRELDLLWPTGDKQSPSCIREVKFRTIKFLMGLNPEYENLRSQLLHWERFPTLSEAVSELQGAESKEKLNTTGETRSTPTAAIHLTKKEEPRGNQTSTPASQIPKAKEGNTSIPVVCAYCRQPGHIKKECRKLAWKEEQIRRGTWKPRDQTNNSWPVKKAYMASEEEGSTSNKDTNSGHEIQKYIQEEMSKILQKMSSTSLVKSGESFAFTTYSGTTPMNNNWILDTRATDHMSPHKSVFQTVKNLIRDRRKKRTNRRKKDKIH